MKKSSHHDSDDARQHKIIKRLNSLDSLQVLVIDDDPIVGRVIGIYPKEIGFEAAILGAFDHLRQTLDDQWPDLVITDIHMPGTDGFGVITEIRSRESDSKSRIPVIAMSGDDIAAECLDAGADAFLRKPIVAERLFLTLDRILA